MHSISLRLCASAMLMALSIANAAMAGTTSTSYSYLQIGLASVSFNEGMEIPHFSGGTEKYDGADGINTAAGWQFHENTFLFFDGTLALNQGNYTSIEWWESQIGLGRALPFNDYVDLLGTIAFASIDAEICSSSFCSTGKGFGSALGLGVRAQITPGLELNAKYERLSLDYEVDRQGMGSEDGGIWRLGLIAGGSGYGLLLESTLHEDSSLLKIGYRYSF